jgi:hypothetical protein
MAPEKQRHTFISYSRINKEFAVKLAKELKAAGFPVWLDQLDIPAGARWDDEIEKALRECGIFMTILTPASIASENAKDEIGYAIDHGKRILPVLLQDCEVPLRLRRFQYVDFTSMNYDQGVRTAKELLAKLIKEESVPRPEKIPPAKERPTRPALVRSQPSNVSDDKVVTPKTIESSTKQSSTKPVALYAGVAIFVLLALIGVVNFLTGIFPFTRQSPTVAPTQEIKPTDLPSPTVTADTATPVPQGFYTEEFDGNLDAWTFLRKGGKEDSEFSYTSKNGNLVVQISPKGDEPSAYLINNAFQYADVQLEVVVTNAGNNSNGISLVCRYGDSGWYEFTISNDQTYSIYVLGPDGAALQGGGPFGSKKILSGKEKNIYTATCKGNELSLAINGTTIETIQTKYDFPEGKIGIGFSAPKNLPVDLQFESLKISQP